MLRSTLHAAARSRTVRAAVESGPFDGLVGRFVAGTDDDAVLVTARELAVDRLVTIDHLGEDTTDRDRADATVAAYVGLLRRIDHINPTVNAYRRIDPHELVPTRACWGCRALSM